MRSLNDYQDEGYFTWGVIGYSIQCILRAPFEWFWNWVTNKNTPLGKNLLETGLLWLGFALLIKHVHLSHPVVDWLLTRVTAFGIILTVIGFFTRYNNKRSVYFIYTGVVVNYFLIDLYSAGMISQAPYHLITLLSFVYLILSPWALLYFDEHSTITKVVSPTTN